MADLLRYGGKPAYLSLELFKPLMDGKDVEKQTDSETGQTHRDKKRLEDQLEVQVAEDQQQAEETAPATTSECG